MFADHASPLRLFQRSLRDARLRGTVRLFCRSHTLPRLGPRISFLRIVVVVPSCSKIEGSLAGRAARLPTARLLFRTVLESLLCRVRHRRSRSGGAGARGRLRRAGDADVENWRTASR